MEFRRGQAPRPQIAPYEEVRSVPGSMIPESVYVRPGNFMALDNGSMGETGGTSAMLRDTQDSTGIPEPRTPATMSESGGPLAIEAPFPGAPQFEKDGQFGMGPPTPTESQPPSSRGLPGGGDDIASLPGGTGIILSTPPGGFLQIPPDHRVNTVFVRGQPNQALAPPFPQGA